MDVNSLTDIGLVRKANEDNYLADIERGLFVVADGMGGHKAGELASCLAIKTIDNMITIDKINQKKGRVLEGVLKTANSLIYNKAKQNSKYNGMGTTVTAALFHDRKLYIGHIGDSRAYLIRNNSIKLLTRDHSLVEELIRQGELSEKDAVNHPHKNVLIRALGTEPDVEIDFIEVDIYSDDKLLLCTDGLYNLVTNQEILQVVLKNGDNLKNSVNDLVNMALDRGGLDNTTVVLVSY